MDHSKLYRLARRAMLAELAVIQVLRGRRCQLGRFGAPSIVTGYRLTVKDKRAAAKRAMAHVPEQYRTLRALLPDLSFSLTDAFYCVRPMSPQGREWLDDAVRSNPAFLGARGEWRVRQATAYDRVMRHATDAGLRVRVE
jgi:hypothetical protein